MTSDECVVRKVTRKHGFGGSGNVWGLHVSQIYTYISILTCPGFKTANQKMFSVDKKNQLDVTFCILYFSSNSCSTCFGQPCAHHQELTTA